MKFENKKLGDLVINFDRKRIPLSSKQRSEHKGNYPYYGATSIMDYVDDYIFEGKYILMGEDGTVINENGTPILQIAEGKFWVNNHAHIFQNTELVTFDYLYYLLKNTNVQALVTGAVQPKITQFNMNNLLLKIHKNKEEQEKITRYLLLLDEKIKLNNSINNNLEQQVSALYQSWFEDFDPTNGVCPDNWSNQTLSTIADISSGKRPPIKSEVYSQETPISIVGAASVMGFTSEANHTDKILVTGRVGTHGVIQRFNTTCWTSDNTLVITSPFYEFTHQILHRIDYSSMNRGSTQPLITQGDMKKVVVLVPDEETLTKFETLACSLMAKWEANNNENVKLASLRDTLLPKLMSGELDVSDIDL